MFTVGNGTKRDYVKTQRNPNSRYNYAFPSLAERRNCFNYAMLQNKTDLSLKDEEKGTCVTIPKNVQGVFPVVKMELLPQCRQEVQNDTVS